MTDAWLPRRLAHAPLQLLSPAEPNDVQDAEVIALSNSTAHPLVDLPALVERAPSLSTLHSDYAAHAASAPVPQSTTSSHRPPLVLARALEDATLLELRWVVSDLVSSASSSTSDWSLPAPFPFTPKLFQFRAPLLPNVAVFFDEPSATFQVIAVTVTGYVYRLTFTGPDYFQVERLAQGGVNETRIAHLNVIDEWGQVYPGRLPQQVHVVDPGLVLITCDDGTIVKLEQDRSLDTYSGFETKWTEGVLHPGSTFNSLARIFTRKPQSAIPDPTSPLRALSVTSYISNDVTPLAFVISKDRKLRIWDLISNTCVRVLSLPPTIQSVSTNEMSDEPFGPQSKPLLTVVGSNGNLLLLVHVPAAGGAPNFFVLYTIQVVPAKGSGSSKVGTIDPTWSVECAPDTSFSDLELRDVALVQFGSAGLRLWTVWDDSGNALIKHINVLDEMYQEGDLSTVSIAANAGPASWSTVHDARYFLPLHGSAFEIAVADVPEDKDSLAQFFLDRIFDAGRFSQRSIEAALAKYEDVLTLTLDPEALPEALAHDSGFDTLWDQCFFVVGSAVTLDTDIETGNALVPQYMSALRREWMRFVGFIENFESAARWTLGFLQPSVAVPRTALPGIPSLVTRDYLSTIAVEDAASVLLRIASDLGRAPSSSSSVSRRRERELAQAAADEKAYLVSPTDSASRTRSQLSRTLVGTNGDALLFLLESSVSLAESTPSSNLLAFLSAIRTKFAGMVSQCAEDEVSAIYRETLNGAMADDAFRFLQETFRKVPDVEAELTTWADLLLGSSQSHAYPHSDIESTLLDTIFLTDAITSVLRARHHNAGLLTFMLALLWVSNGLEQNVPSIPALFSRAISVLQTTGALLEAASFAGAPNVPLHGAFQPTDDVADQMGSLRVTTTQPEGPAWSPLHFALQKHVLPLPVARTTHSDQVLSGQTLGLVSHLLSEGKDTPPLPALTENLAQLVHRWLVAGYIAAADTILDAYPYSLAGTYLHALSLLMQDDVEDEEVRAKLDSVALALASLDALVEDDSGLLLVLPEAVANLVPSHAAKAMFLYHLTQMFLKLEQPQHVAWYGSQALTLLQSFDKVTMRTLRHTAGLNKSSLKTLVSDLGFATFRAQVQLELWQDAYLTIMRSGTKAFQSECIHSLVTAMCESGQSHTLFNFNFSGLQAEVEKTLQFKARNADPFAVPDYFQLLYSYFVQQGELKSAGMVMYLHAHHLAEHGHLQPSGTWVRIAQTQAKSLLCAINVLSLLPQRDQWFSYPIARTTTVFDSEGQENNKVSRITQYVPLSAYKASEPMAYVRLEDLRAEHALLRARLDLVQTYPELAASQSPLAPADAVALYVRADQFEAAIRLGRTLQVDLSVVFQALTTRCLKLSEMGSTRLADLQDAGINPSGTGAAFTQLREEVELQSWDEASFLASSPLSSTWPGAVEEKAWHYLRLMLNNLPETTRTTYYLVVLQRALDAGADVEQYLPTWLPSWFTTHKPDLLLRAYMRHDRIEAALRTALTLVRSPLPHVPSTLVSDSEAVKASTAKVESFVPYTLLDELLYHVENPDPLAPSGRTDVLVARTLAKDLRAAVSDRLARTTQVQRRREQAWVRVAPQAQAI